MRYVLALMFAFILASPTHAQSLCSTLGLAADCVGDVKQISGGMQLSPSTTAGNVVVLGADVPFSVLQTAVPPGQIFNFAAGTYRQLSIVPQNDQQFIGAGQGQTIIKGSRILSGATLVSGLWQFTGITENGPQDGFGNCGGVNIDCYHDEDVTLDGGIHLSHMTSLANVTGPGQYFIDYTAQTLSMFDNPTGRLVEMNSTGYAFSGIAQGVVIKHMTIAQYATVAEEGCVGGNSNSPGVGQGWTVEDVEIRECHGAGVNLGTNWKVIHNYIHNNGQQGYISGCCFTNVYNILLADNEIAYNNTDSFSSGWEAGAGKMIKSIHSIVRNNWVHDNVGKGIWYDDDNFDAQVTDNLVENQYYDVGIQDEISYGSAVIRGNTIRGSCAGATRNGSFGGCGQIFIGTASDVDVSFNSIDDNIQGPTGISLVEQTRSFGVAGNWVSHKVRIHDNDISSKYGYTGAPAASVGSFDATDGKSNPWNGNHYHVPVASLNYFLTGSGGTNDTFTQWQAAGYDPHGTIDNNYGEEPYNLLCSPQDLDDVWCWNVSVGAQASAAVTPDTTVAPDGTTTADTVALTGGTDAFTLAHSTLSNEFGVREDNGAVTKYSCSIYVEGTSTQKVNVDVIDIDSATILGATQITFNGAWQLASVTNVTPAGSGPAFLSLSTNGNGGGGTALANVTFKAWGAQCNPGTTCAVGVCSGAANLYAPPGDLRFPLTFFPTKWDTNFKSPNLMVQANGINVVQTANSGTASLVRANKPISVGKHHSEYWAQTVLSEKTCIGIANALEGVTVFVGQTPNSIGYCSDGTVMKNNVSLGNIGSYTYGDVITVEVDVGGNTIQFAKDGGALSSFATGTVTATLPVYAALNTIAITNLGLVDGGYANFNGPFDEPVSAGYFPY
jgi:hypothetical protein